MTDRQRIGEAQPLFRRTLRQGWECRYRIPNLIVSKRGTVFALPEERVNGLADEAKRHLVLRRSLDHGHTWTAMNVLYADDHPRVSHGYSGGVADLDTGRVFVFFRVSVVIGPDDIGGVWPEPWEIEHPAEATALRAKLAPHVQTGLHLIWTDDEGESWSAPRPLDDALHVTNPVTGELRPFWPQFTGIQLRRGAHRGRLVIPGRGVSHTVPFALYAYGHNYVVYSDDHGVTWQPGGLTQNGTGEACLIEQSDGTLYVNSRNESLRCRGYRAWDRSDDGGATFTVSGYDLALPEPHCAASLSRLPDGGILFCNPAVHSATPTVYDHAARHHLTVRLSYDDARTWPVARTLCAGRAGYSALAVAHDGAILCAYETLTADSYTGDIMLVRLSQGMLL
ncbi:MAG TPA: sialidase family protein [Armatimonadota bacterium]|nr:sialidase family protein [Armatimonadota bacterium]HOS44536.1 sialidase family protein [Armatimonadota bacterium]